jgi:hypothetical protein
MRVDKLQAAKKDSSISLEAETKPGLGKRPRLAAVRIIDTPFPKLITSAAAARVTAGFD